MFAAGFVLDEGDDADDLSRQNVSARKDKMKRKGQLMARIADPENLRLAFWKAAKGKRGKADCRAFREGLDVQVSVLTFYTTRFGRSFTKQIETRRKSGSHGDGVSQSAPPVQVSMLTVDTFLLDTHIQRILQFCVNSED